MLIRTSFFFVTVIIILFVYASVLAFFRSHSVLFVFIYFDTRSIPCTQVSGLLIKMYRGAFSLSRVHASADSRDFLFENSRDFFCKFEQTSDWIGHNYPSEIFNEKNVTRDRWWVVEWKIYNIICSRIIMTRVNAACLVTPRTNHMKSMYLISCVLVE